MNMTGRITCFLFLVVAILGKPATDYSGSIQLTGTEDEQLKEILSFNALNMKKLKANVTSLWAEINGIKKWTRQHEKGLHHNYESLGYHGHGYGYHAPDGHQPYYGGHYSHWYPGMFPPRVWYQYHIHDIELGRSHHLPIHAKNHEYSSSKKKTDDSSEEEEEEDEEEEEKKEKSDEKKKKKKMKSKEEEVEEEEKPEEEKKVEKGEVEEVEVKEDNLVVEVAEEEEVKKSNVIEKEKKVEEEKTIEDEEVENVVVKKGAKKVEEENKAEEEVEEEEEEAKLRGRSLFGFKQVVKHGHKQGHSPQHDRKGHKNTLFHNIKGHFKSKNRPKNEAKNIDGNEIISKAFCHFAPNIEIPESEVTGNVTIFQKRNSKGPLYFHVNLQINLIFVGMDEESRTHGFHIHANPISAIGHCNSTGQHFNPTGKTHGSLHSEIRHLGDFGNIVVDKSGKLDQYIFVDSTNTLVGENSIISRSIDVHENPDDLGKGAEESSLQAGNAGRKLACCTIHSLTRLNR